MDREDELLAAIKQSDWALMEFEDDCSREQRNIQEAYDSVEEFYQTISFVVLLKSISILLT